MVLTMDKARMSLIRSRNKLVQTIKAVEELGSETERRTELAVRRAFIDATHTESVEIIKTCFMDEEAAEFEEINQISDEIDALYFRIKRMDVDARPSVSISPTPSTIQNNIKLPRINVPVFTGKLDEWPNFYDLYRTLVHENQTISQIEKFQLLRLSLRGEPLSLIKGLVLNADNYVIAYNSLISRYEDKRMLATTYWTNIYKASSKGVQKGPEALRALFQVFTENIDALNNYGIDLWDFTLFNLLLQSLDPAMRQRFEVDHCDQRIPTFHMLRVFVEKQCKAAETTLMNRVPVAEQHNGQRAPGAQRDRVDGNRRPPVIRTYAANYDRKGCFYCGQNHFIKQCYEFMRMAPKDRFNWVKAKNGCINCLDNSHGVNNCHSKYRCRDCQGLHHSLLHFGNRPESRGADPPRGPSTSGNNEAVNSLAGRVGGSQTVLLATAVVRIIDRAGREHTVRALLDSGSQSSFITEKCRQRLGLSRTKTDVAVYGVGRTALDACGGSNCVILARNDPSPKIQVDVLILPKITDNMPTAGIHRKSWSHTSNLYLADPEFGVSRRIDLLLGADIFATILLSGRLAGKTGEPSAIETVFGWVLTGPVRTSGGAASSSLSFHATETKLDAALRRFWEIEDVPHVVTKAPEDIECERRYRETCTREDSGRFVVSLPFKGEPQPVFEDSRLVAMRRFLALERRLVQNTPVYQMYGEFMRDYLECGHMTEIGALPSEKGTAPIYYIPHHCVLRPESSTTKLRVVFDASAKVAGISLNETLLVGEKLQQNLIGVLLRFRVHAVVFTADIKQMYRQILINPDHRDYQRILWRFSPSEPVRDFVLNTVTYGVSSAPYLAIRTLIELASREQARFPRAAKILESDFYVDDLVTGCQSIEEAQSIQQELTDLLSLGGFDLRKWATNRPEMLSNLPDAVCQLNARSFDADHTIKILGFRWCPSTDNFSYTVNSTERKCTKRTILSEIAKVFDPLGLLSPLTLFAKQLIQELWSLGLQWDETPPQHILSKWSNYLADLTHLANVQVPRQLVVETQEVQLHAFCDASEHGYAAVIYLRGITANNEITVSLVCAKAKVSPLKRISIPRLELCGAVLLADLVQFVTDTLRESFPRMEIFAWSDSMVALSWVRSSAHRWKTFVSNRVSHIQEIISPSAWHYIRSGENPADCASRGLLPRELVEHPLWWAGPSFLRTPQADWGTPPHVSEPSDESLVAAEERVHAFVGTVGTTAPMDKVLSTYSDLKRIVRIVALFRRCATNYRSSNKQSGAYTPTELEGALLALVRHVQMQSFADEIKQLRAGKLASKAIRRLNPFLDEAGLLRVGGRLRHAEVPYALKHPLLLPKSHQLTELLIRDYHVRYLHPGLRTMQYLLSQNYWVISGKQAIRQCIKGCMRCFRMRPVALTPSMGDLPKPRVNQAKAFQCAGVDYGGPFTITMSKTRGAKTTKAYICLFVCFSTKAVHLEVASDLSAEAFLAALRRFIGRRGRCTSLFSDCGTNFIGANRQLHQMMKQGAEEEIISWSFNPPSAPHFGGLWEAGIKSFKGHLSRVIGDQLLTYEELNTVAVQIEALLNSRPLCAISTDPNDLTALTPGHFLTLEPLSTVPDPDLGHLKINRLSRWQLLQRIQQDFWKRWHLEYLHTLQQRNKWTDTRSELSVNELVLIKDEQAPPMRWRLARVSELHPGKDGVVRVATVKGPFGSQRRPLVKLCPLPNQ